MGVGRWPDWIALLAAMCVAWFAIQAQQLPAPLPADAPANLFAAGRAQKHVEAIARAPHPMGSPESEQVRETLLRRFSEIGLDAKLQLPKRKEAPFPQNVVARLNGTGPSLPMAQPVMVLVVLFIGALMPVWGPIFAIEPTPLRLRKWRRSAALQPQAEHAS